MLKLPKGFHTITPYLMCDAPLELANFMRLAFNATELGRTVLHDDRIVNLQMLVGDTVLMLSQSDERYHATENAAYYLYGEDADLMMQAALDAGACLEMKVADMPYGDRQGGVKDPFGNIWWLSQRVMEKPYHED